MKSEILDKSTQSTEKSSPVKNIEKEAKVEKKSVETKSELSAQVNNQSQINSAQSQNNPQKNNTQKNFKIKQAKLTLPKKVKANQTIPVSIDVKVAKTVKTAKTRKPTSEPLNAQKMNLVLVSDDLRFFDFVNSSYQGNGKFQVKPKFPSPGIYSLFSTYEVSNQEKQVFIEKIDIPGSVPLPKELETYSKTQKLGDTKVDLHLSQSKVKAGKPVTLKFDIRESKSNKSVTNLQNYLGKKAQLVIIKSSYPLSKSDFIPNQIVQKNPDHNLSFQTSFPHQGTYKLWLKFNRGGKIKTADFWVNIS
ncbi:MAG: hypothetical protein AAF208_10090 [Cyanobacteria bacterium P01_A01_bin.45]